MFDVANINSSYKYTERTEEKHNLNEWTQVNINQETETIESHLEILKNTITEMKNLWEDLREWRQNVSQ